MRLPASGRASGERAEQPVHARDVGEGGLAVRLEHDGQVYEGEDACHGGAAGAHLQALQVLVLERQHEDLIAAVAHISSRWGRRPR